MAPLEPDGVKDTALINRVGTGDLSHHGNMNKALNVETWSFPSREQRH